MWTYLKLIIGFIFLGLSVISFIAMTAFRDIQLNEVTGGFLGFIIFLAIVGYYFIDSSVKKIIK